MQAKITTEIQVFIHTTLNEREAAALARLAGFNVSDVLAALATITGDFDPTSGKHAVGLKSLLASAKELEPKLDKIKRVLAHELEGKL